MQGSRNLVDADTLAGHLEDPSWRIVDCRYALNQPHAGRAAYASGHIPGALYAHLHDDLAGAVTPTSGRHPLPRPEAFVARLRAWGITAGTTVVAYDDNGGGFAARLWWLLRDYGHEHARVLDGGIQAWVAAGRPLSRGPPRPAPEGSFHGVPGRMPHATAQDILRAKLTVLDAREAARYDGTSEPVDAKAGHIPGALNAHYKANLAPDGRFKDPAALREAYKRLLGDRGGAQTVAYCGSGVTACHTVLAMEEAGLGTAALYAGSWSEWIRDPKRPVRTGRAP